MALIIFKDSDSKEEELDAEEEMDIGKAFSAWDIDDTMGQDGIDDENYLTN